jgi:hypothetical protein
MRKVSANAAADKITARGPKNTRAYVEMPSASHARKSTIRQNPVI